MALYIGYSTVNDLKQKVRLTDTALIKQDLINHFNIRRGEKLMNPDFGTIIWDVLFEPFTEHLKNKILEDVTRIANNDPRRRVESILVDTYDNGMLLDLTISYTNTNEVENLRFTFDKSAK